MSRRAFFSVAGGALIAAREGIGPYKLDSFSDNFTVTQEQIEELSNYKNVTTIAHRAGNNIEDLVQSHNVQANFTEVDVTHVNGSFYADHKRYFAGIIGYEKSKRFISLGGPDTSLKDVLVSAKTYNQPLFFDLIIPSERTNSFSQKLTPLSKTPLTVLRIGTSLIK